VGEKVTVTDVTRRYTWKAYPHDEWDAALHNHRGMVADLWNGLKTLYEDSLRRTTGQRGVRHHRRDLETGELILEEPLTRWELSDAISELRRECPEWAAINRGTEERVIKLFIDAVKAAYRRLKEFRDHPAVFAAAYEARAPGFRRRWGRNPTRFDLCGWPRWKSRRLATTIPLREMGDNGNHGWELVQWYPHPRTWRAARLGLPESRSWRLHVSGLSDGRDYGTWLHCKNWLPHDKDGNPIKVTKWRNADIIFRDGHWWLSVCVDLEPRRAPGDETISVEFDLIDATAKVNGEPVSLPDKERLETLDDERAELQSQHDEAWPRARRLTDDQKAERRASWRVISQRSAFIARIRRNALHVLSHQLVRRARDLTVIMPSLKKHVRTPRGDKEDWGAMVEPVSTLNRSVLGQAPGMMVQMLVYKAAEAGIRCDVVTAAAPKIKVGRDLVTTGKLARRGRREARKAT
jgi:hypothetical protein